MALGANEKQRSAVPVQDLDGRLIVVGPNGVPISGGASGGGADPLSDGDPAGALPTKTLWVAGADGTVLRGMVVDATGRLRTVLEGTPNVAVSNFPASQPVSGPLTDAQLRAAAVPVSGPLTDTQLRATAVPVSVSNFPATQAVSGTVTATGPLTDTQLRASAVPVSGTVTANIPGSATSAVTNVAASATNVTLKAANAGRKALYIFNAGTSTLFVKLGATATTTTSYTAQVPASAFWELPDDPIYTGIVDGIWSATGGNGALVTELT
jgi:hypothetical protein